MGLEDIFDNKIVDGMGDVVEFVLNNRDELDKLLELARNAPEALEKLAAGLADAGDRAKDAAVQLVGTTGSGGAAKALTSGSGSLTNIGDRIGDASGLIKSVGAAMDRVPLMDAPAKGLTDTAGSLAKAQKDLANLGKDLAQLAAILVKVGDALDGLGDRLKDTSGSAAKLFG